MDRARPEVIIDPGHGGSLAYGGSSPMGVEPQAGMAEKHVNLELARRVADRLGGIAQLTRSGDVNVPLRERAQLAARSGARVLVSIHANSGNHGTNGSEVWLHDRHDGRSAELAREIHANLDRVGPTRGVFRGPLAVLDPSDTGGAAACLIEADYLSDPRGRDRLTNSRGLDELADAISSGVRGYLGRGAGQGQAQGHAQGYGRVPAQRDYESYDGYDRSRSADRFGAWAEAKSIIEPDVNYGASSLADANRIWSDWLSRYGRWFKGVPDSALSYFPHSAICQLRMTMTTASGTVGHFWGTGFYIGNNKLLSCGHNFRIVSGGQTWTATSILVEPGYSPMASIHDSRSYRINNYLNHVHPNWSSSSSDSFQEGYDLSVLHVDNLSAPGRQYFSLANRSLGGDEGIVVSGYGKVDGSRFESQPQRMDGAIITRADHLTMDYPIQTVGGHSGSPVFHGEMVVGVHRSANNATTNSAAVLTPEKIEWINRTSGNP